jgi:hypothetical protein
MTRIRTLAILNFLFLAIHIFLSYGSQTRLYADRTVKEVSDRYASVFTPAGITFSIWGVIYISLIAFCLYHLIKAFNADNKHEANIVLDKVGIHFIINNLATIGWLIAWTQGLTGSALVLIIIQLLSLVTIHTRLGIFNRDASSSSKVFTQVPLSIYLGWICIATIANASSYLVATGWDGWGIDQSHWAMMLIGMATVLSLVMIFIRKNIFFNLVVIWAVYGIILKRRESGAAQYEQLIQTAWIAIVILGIALVLRIYRNKKRLDRSL